MRILSWNINGVQAHLDAVNRLVAEWNPDILCFQNSRKKGAFLAKVPGYMGCLGIIGETLFGGVSAYLHKGLPFDFSNQYNDTPKWLNHAGCLNVIRFDQFILVNAYFPIVDLSNEEYVKNRQRWDYELHDYLTRLTNKKPVILCGGQNIVNEDIDVWDGMSVKRLGG